MKHEPPNKGHLWDIKNYIAILYIDVSPIKGKIIDSSIIRDKSKGILYTELGCTLFGVSFIRGSIVLFFNNLS